MHQLLRPVLARLDHLPGPQRDALSAAFGTIDVPAPDPFMIALAALNLLTDAAEHLPLLLVIDEAHWLDPPTASVLAFIARRVEAEPIAVLFAVRDGAGSVVDNAGLPELRLGGLDDEEPKTLKEAKGYIVSDYQEYLEKTWLEQLRKKYPIVVDDNVFRSLIKKQ